MITADFDTVIDGMAKYIDTYICKNLNDWQDIMVHMIVGRVYDNKAAIQKALTDNGFIRAFCVIDGDGKVDIERLLYELKAQIQRKQKVSISVPLLGTMTFTADDVDMLRKTIIGDVRNDGNDGNEGNNDQG